MFLLSLLTNKDSYNTQIIQCVNDTIFKKTVPVPWNRFIRQITATQSNCCGYLYFLSLKPCPQQPELNAERTDYKI